MNARERVLAMIVLSGVILGGAAFLFYRFLLVPLNERDVAIALLRSENQQKQERIDQVLAVRPKLEWWRRLSLPADVSLASREYEKYLTELLRKSGFATGSFVTPKQIDEKSSATLTAKAPVFIRLPFTVQAQGNLSSLIEFLQRFYRTGLMQQVQTLSVQRPVTATGTQQGARDLIITLAVEALIVSGAADRRQLLPIVDNRLLALDMGNVLQQGPPGLALAIWGAAGPSGPLGRRALAEPVRTYAALAGKDIFFGPLSSTADRPVEEVDYTRFVHLTDITHNDRRTEAFLYDRYNNRRTRLRASAGFDSFRFVDSKGEPIVRGQVVRIDNREVFVRVDDKYFSIHVGQNLEEALRKPLAESQIKELGLAAARR